MLTTDHRKTFEQSLVSDKPAARLTDAIRHLLKDPQNDRDGLLGELEEFRVLLRQDQRESDDDVVLEVMDFLTGWASPHAKLVPTKRPNKRSNAS